MAEVLAVSADPKLFRVRANNKSRRHGYVFGHGAARFDRGDIFQLPDGAPLGNGRALGEAELKAKPTSGRSQLETLEKGTHERGLELVSRKARLLGFGQPVFASLPMTLG